MLKATSRTKKGNKIFSLEGALPKGELMWVNISGEGKENYNGDGMEYTATIVYPTTTGEEIQGEIQKWLDTMDTDGLESQGNPLLGRVGVVEQVDGEEKEKFLAPSKVTDKMTLSGRVSFAFKTQTEFNGKPNKVAVYNSQNPPKKVNLGETKIGNGSLGSLQVNIQFGTRARVYYVSSYLQAVQVFKLEEYGEGNDFEGDDSEEGWTGADTDDDTGFTGEVASDNSAEAPDLG